MKANIINYFKNGKLYQYDPKMLLYIITKVDIDGIFCLDKKMMEKFLKIKSPKVSYEDGFIRVENDLYKTKLITTKVDLFEPDLRIDGSFVVEPNYVKKALNFVSKDNKNPSLKGVYISKTGVFATNSYFIYRSSECGDETIIITTNFAKELIKEKKPILLNFNSRYVFYEREDESIVLSPISKGFLKIDSFYKNKYFDKVNISRKLLNNLLEFSDDDDLITFENDLIKVRNVKTKTEFETIFDGNFYNQLNFECKFFKTIIENVDKDYITLEYVDGRKLVKINDEFIILPKRVD